MTFKRNWKWWGGSTDFSFVDEDTSHLRGTVIHRNFRVRGDLNPHQVIEHKWYCPDVNAFFATSRHKIYVHFFFARILKKSCVDRLSVIHANFNFYDFFSTVYFVLIVLCLHYRSLYYFLFCMQIRTEHISPRIGAIWCGFQRGFVVITS